MVWNDYFELRWFSTRYADQAHPDGQTVVRRFRMLLQDAQHENRMNLNGYALNLQGYLMVVRVPFRPHQVVGMIRIDEDEEVVAPDGNRYDLEEAALASTLEAKMYADTDYWKAEWVGSWTPGHYDPGGYFWFFPVELREKEPAA